MDQIDNIIAVIKFLFGRAYTRENVWYNNMNLYIVNSYHKEEEGPINNRNEGVDNLDTEKEL